LGTFDRRAIGLSDGALEGGAGDSLRMDSRAHPQAQTGRENHGVDPTTI
jgi:hypothetical protein